MNIKDFDPALRQKLVLFLSADLIGSTAMKQKSESGKDWLKIVTTFFSLWQSHFSAEFKKQKNLFFAHAAESTFVGQYSSTINCNPEPWETFGDEIIYRCELNSCVEALIIILAWNETARSVSNQLDIGIKQSAWTAGFPVINKEIIIRPSASLACVDESIPRNDGVILNYAHLSKFHTTPDDYPNVSIDYTGPSIDTGFRIGSQSTLRKFTVSIELALLISKIISHKYSGQKPFEWLEGKFKFRYDGRIKLKGVLDSSDYPIFWLDTNKSDLNGYEDRLLRDNNYCEYSDVVEFCHGFIANVANYRLIAPPYVTNCPCCQNKEFDHIKFHLEEIESTYKLISESLKLDSSHDESSLEKSEIDPTEEVAMDDIVVNNMMQSIIPK